MFPASKIQKFQLKKKKKKKKNHNKIIIVIIIIKQMWKGCTSQEKMDNGA